MTQLLVRRFLAVALVGLCASIPELMSALVAQTAEQPDVGLRQAGDGEDGLGGQGRRHVLYVTPDGRARGRISLINPATHELVPASDVTLTFFNLDGTTAYTATVETNGTFQLSEVPQGVFAVVAAGPTAFMTFGVQTIRVEDLVPQEDWSFDGAAVPERDFPALVAVLSMFDGRQPGMLDLQEPDVDQIPPAAVEQENTVPEDGTNVNAMATPLSHHAAFLHANSMLRGRMRRWDPQTGQLSAATNLNAHLVRNGEIVASTATTELGTFEFDNVIPGIYSLLGEGPDGFVALSVDVQELPPPALGGDENLPQDVALVAPQPGLEIDAATVPSSVIPQIQDAFQQATQPSASPLAGGPPVAPPAMSAPPGSTPAGGGGGGTTGGGGSAAGGGGGLFGGGSGLAEALLLGGLAAGAIALADDDDDNQRPMSPSTPGPPFTPPGPPFTRPGPPPFVPPPF